MSERVGIIGAGIVGLAHAWSAAQNGHHVTVFERTRCASGASIRNFGMVWPMVQPLEKMAIAMLSRSRWLQLGQEAGIWVKARGSMILAHHRDEWEVLQEFHAYHQNTALGKHVQLLGREQALGRCAAINPQHFLGALYSNLELCLNPAAAVRALPSWLKEKFGVHWNFETTVVEAKTGELRVASGAIHSFDRIVICCGHDFETLFPELFHSAQIQKCKLQMMRTVPQGEAFELGASLAGGLTLRQYPCFQCCHSLQEVADRIEQENPELVTKGIHVLASQDDCGRMTLGDSHEYGDELEPFDSTLIDDLIIREMRKIIQIPDWRIESRWHGIYAKAFDSIDFSFQPVPRVHLCTGLGGSGMTLSFGLAEQMWQAWNTENLN